MHLTVYFLKSQINNNRETTTSVWTGLYKVGSVSALLLVVIIITTGIIFAIEPQPLDGTALDWFMLFQNNKIIGLIDFELLMVIYTIISIPISVALYMTLSRVNQPFTALYLALSLIGVMAFIAAITMAAAPPTL